MTFSEDRKRKIELSIALYAALLATVSLGWQMLNQMRSQPVLEIGEKGWPREIGLRPGPEPLELDYSVTLANKGSKPISLFVGTAYAELYNLDGSPAPLKSMFSIIDRDPLPVKLDENEVSKWHCTFQFTKTGQIVSNTQFRAKIYLFFKTTAGDMNLHDEITVRYVE